ncbi:MAG: glycosyltransferase family 2 protein [Candidatus Paceibacterota bacterium]
MDEVQCAENVGRLQDSTVQQVTSTVSIVVPVYHGAQFIHQLLDSINSQTYRDFILVLVIDDFEYDNTVDIVCKHALYEDGKVHLLLRSSKSNPAIARNKGIEHVTSKYVCFIDVDDTWEPDKLEQQVRYANVLNHDVVFTSGWWHRDFGTLHVMADIVSVNEGFPEQLFLWSSIMIRHDALMCVKDMRGYIFDATLSQCDDIELLLCLKHTQCACGFGAVYALLTHVYEHGGNLTQGNLWTPCYITAKILMKYGHYIQAMKQIFFAMVAITTDKLHLRQWLRRRKFIWRSRFGVTDGDVASDRTDN